MNTYPQPACRHLNSGWRSTLRWATLVSAAIALLIGCQDLDGPAEPLLPSEPTAARTSGSPLAAPSNTNALAISQSQIDITWQDNSSNETRFEIHRSTVGASGTFSLIATAAANSAAYSDAGLEQATEYCYRVRAVRVTGSKTIYSAFSNTGCATTLLPAPFNASAVVVSSSQIDISWQDNSSNETRFEIQRSSTAEDGTFALVATTAPDVAAYSDQGLVPDAGYCYRVRAVRVAGTITYSAFSNTACATTPVPDPPAAATETRAYPYDSRTVGVTWNGSINATSYRIDRSIDGGAGWDPIDTVPYSSEFYDYPLPSEQSVCYRVVASNAGGDAPPSNTACTAPPAGPTNLTVTEVDPETVELTWNDNSSVEDGYQVWLVVVWGSCGCGGGGSGCNADLYGYESLVAVLPSSTTAYQTAAPYNDCNTGSSFAVVATKDGGRSDVAGAQLGVWSTVDATRSPDSKYVTLLGSASCTPPRS